MVARETGRIVFGGWGGGGVRVPFTPVPLSTLCRRPIFSPVVGGGTPLL